MTRQTDEKRQEWHGYLRKHEKRSEDAAGPLEVGGNLTTNSPKQAKPEEDWIKNTSQEEKWG